MLQVNDTILKDLIKKEAKLDRLYGKKSRAEYSANSKNSSLDRLNKQILDLETLLAGEYEARPLIKTYI